MKQELPAVGRYSDLLTYMYSCDAAHAQGMEYVMRKGFTKAIGLSNFTITKTEKLLETARIPPAVLQGILEQLYLLIVIYRLGLTKPYL